MEKVWFFVEGDSEENLVKSFIRNHLYNNFKLELDIAAFVHSSINDYHLGFCENCGSVDKVPHRINEIYHLIEQSNANHIIVICDIENLGCFTNRKNKILEILESNIDKSKLKFIFFNPMIENHYWDCESNIIGVLKKEIKNKFNRTEANITIASDITKNQVGIKKLFNKYNVKFRESKFSESFFSRTNFEECSNLSIIRLKSQLNFVIPHNT